MKAQWLVGSVLVGSALTIVACGGRTTAVAGDPLDGGSGSRLDSGSGSGTAIGTGVGSGSGTYTGSGSGSGTYIGSGSGSGTYIGSGSGSGTYTGSGSGSGTYIGSGSGSGTYTGSGSGSGCDENNVPICEGCGNYVSPECTPNGWQCPPPPPCVAPFDAGFPDASIPPLPEAGAPELQCGAMSCDAANTYCVIEHGEPPPNGTSFSCVIYPPECTGIPSCGCLDQNSGGCSCAQDPSTGGLTLTCSSQ